VRSFISVYELLPTYRCLDTGTGELVRLDAVAQLPNASTVWLRDGQDFHLEIGDAVTRHQSDEAYARSGYLLFPIVGTHQPTAQSARLAGDMVHLLGAYAGVDYSGDGTVPRVSATPAELGEAHREMFAATRHAALHRSEGVLTHIHNVIKGLYIDLDRFRPGSALQRPLSLAVEDAYWSDEPVRLGVWPEGARMPKLEVQVVDLSTDTTVACERIAAGPPVWHTVDIGVLRGGAYRITVSGGERVHPVSDVFEVYEPGTARRQER
jgi:hypothetical protein